MKGLINIYNRNISNKSMNLLLDRLFFVLVISYVSDNEMEIAL